MSRCEVGFRDSVVIDFEKMSACIIVPHFCLFIVLFSIIILNYVTPLYQPGVGTTVLLVTMIV